jgi:hypothetical protein
MTNRLTAGDRNAIIPNLPSCSDDLDRRHLSTIVKSDRLWLSEMVNGVWPTKAEAAIVQYHGCPVSTAWSYKRGDRVGSATVLRDLLRGAEGYIVLKFIMKDSPPDWWVNVERHRHIGEQVERTVLQRE